MNQKTEVLTVITDTFGTVASPASVVSQESETF